jgi:hypothetical protein
MGVLKPLTTNSMPDGDGQPPIAYRTVPTRATCSVSAAAQANEPSAATRNSSHAAVLDRRSTHSGAQISGIATCNAGR